MNEEKYSTSLWLLIVWVGAVLLGFTWSSYESFDTPKEALIKIGVAVLGGVVLLRWLQRRTIRFVWHPLTGLALAFWGWGWLSLLVSSHRLLTFHAQLFALHLILLLVFVPVLLSERGDLDHFWRTVSMLGGVVAAVAVAQWAGLDFEHGLQFQPHWLQLPKVEIYSTIGNANYLAAVLAFLLPVTIASAAAWRRQAAGSAHEGASPDKMRQDRRAPVLLLWTSVVVSIAALLLTRSKGGLAAAGVGMVVLWVIWGVSHRWSTTKMVLTGAVGVGLAGLSLALMFWLAPTLGADWEKLVNRAWNDPSVKGRVLMWETTMEMAAAHPIVGIGTGTFGAQYQPYRAVVFDRLPDPASVYPAKEHSYDEAGNAHNDWLQLAAENGIVGLILFSAVVIYYFVGGIKLIMSENGSNVVSTISFSNHLPFPAAVASPSLLCGLLAGMAAMLTHALVDFPLHQPAATLLFWLGLATVVAAGGRPKAWPLPEWMASTAARRSAGGAIIVGIGLLTVQAVRPVIAGVYQREAWLLMTDRHWAEAIPAIRTGLRWEPCHPELTLYLGVASYNQGDLEGSRAAYERYQLLYSDFQTLYNLGLIAVRERRLDQAERYFREALRYKPTLAQAAMALALVAEQMGRPDEARRYRRQALQLRDAGA
ncbi:MAG TPA: O-antigen ligase family protein [Nitrospiria bacterium]|nr:O-antigen ligase family protein [Nitrospiria bacterium]